MCLPPQLLKNFFQGRFKLKTMNTLILPSINLLILLAVLFYFLRQPIKDFVKARHHSVATELQKSQGMLRESKIKYDEFVTRLSSVDSEIESLRMTSRQDALEMKARILAQAQKLSVNIQSDAKNAAMTLRNELKSELSKELGEAVLSRAAKIISTKLSSADHSKIRNDFARQVGGSQ